MIMRIIAFFLILWSFSVYSQVNLSDSTVQVIAYWKKGDIRKYSVVNENIKVTGGDTVSKNYLSFDVTINVLKQKKDSYTIKWYCDNARLSEDRIIPKELFSYIKPEKIIFKTNELGEFVEIINVNEIKDCLDKSRKLFMKFIDTLPEGLKQYMQQYDSAYNSEEGLEIIMTQHIQQFHSFYGAAYKLNERLKVNNQLENLLGGEPFNVEVSVELEEIDQVNDEYKLKLIQTFDQEQLRWFIIRQMELLTKGLDKEIPDFEELLTEINRETTLETTYNNAGWLQKSVRITDVNSKDVRQLQISTIIRKE